MNDISPEETKIFPCIWQALLLLFVSFIALLIMGVGIGIVGTIGKMLKNEFLVFASAFLQPLANLILMPIAIGVLYFTKAPFKKIFCFKTTKIIYILPLIVLVLGSSIIESEVDNIVRYILPMPQFLLDIMMSIIQDKWSSFVLLVIIASLTEELLCRGVILRGFLTHYSKTKSIIISAMLFSLFHMNIYQFFSAFILGLILGWVYTETRSLYLCFFIHSFHNFLCWMFAFNIINLHIPGYSDGTVDYNITEFQPLWFNATGIVLCIIGFFLLKKVFNLKSL
jgi:CAAX protease family protein